MDVSVFYNYWTVMLYSMFAIGLVLVFFYEYSNFRRKH